MKRHKRFTIFFAVLLVCSLTACSTTAAVTEETSTFQSSASSVGTAEAVALSKEDSDSTWDSSATMITLSESAATIQGNGATQSEGTVTITAGGTYVLSGETSQGRIIVEAPKTTIVHLVLNGVSIVSDKNAAIYCRQADKLLVTLAEGTVNTLVDAETYTYDNTEKEEPDAALFSTVDLTLNGTGTLVVKAEFNNGIGSKDDLIIVSGKYDITAANHGIRGRDSLTVLDGSFAITSGNDGLQSNNDTDVSKGWIRIQGGSFAITSGHDAIQSETDLTILKGEFDILSGGGHAGTPSADGTDSDSYKGIKAGGNLVLSGGSLTIDSADDAVHSNGSIAISGVNMALSTGDDGIHADDTLTIHSGTVTISTSYEGIEASTITIEGGVLDITSSDDGINVAGGVDDNTGDTRQPSAFGGDRFGSSSNNWLYIHGGTITVDATGDGLDANGNIQMTGGEVFIHGTTGQGDGAIDFDGRFSLDGGTLVAVGSRAMFQSPSDSSQQPSATIFLSQQYPTGSVLTLQDSSGEELVSFTSKKTFSAVTFSSKDLAVGQEYTLLLDGAQSVTFSLTETITRISDTGEAVTGGMGGMGGPEGLGGRAERGGQGRKGMEGTPPEIGTPPSTSFEERGARFTEPSREG